MISLKMVKTGSEPVLVAEERAHRVYDLSSAGRMLVTRNVGRRVREELAGVLESLPRGGVLYVDTRGVEFMDYSFADETFGVLISRAAGGEFQDRYVVLVERERDLLENVEASLLQRKLALLRVNDVGESPQVVGSLPEHLLNTLQVIQQAHSITNSELAARLDLNHTAGNNRAAKLARLGLIHRRVETAAPSGRQYVYEKIV